MSRKDVLNADGENVQAIQQASFFSSSSSTFVLLLDPIIV